MMRGMHSGSHNEKDDEQLKQDLENLKEQNDSSEQENSASNELRYRYWNYALPIIQQANGENGKEWKVMSGGNANLAARTFGMSGFSILCTANYDKVRVH